MLEQQPMVSVSLCHCPPEALMSKAHHAGKAREFLPFHLALPDAIPQLHTFPTEVTTATSAIPNYLKVQPKCKPGVCHSALLHAATLQSSSLNHFAKPKSVGWQSSPLILIFQWYEWHWQVGERRVVVMVKYQSGQREILGSSQPASVTAEKWYFKMLFLSESASVLKQIRLTAFSVSEESWSRIVISMNWCNFFFLKVLIHREGVWNQNIDMILI